MYTGWEVETGDDERRMPAQKRIERDESTSFAFLCWL
jgi:hypothetical protein